MSSYVRATRLPRVSITQDEFVPGRTFTTSTRTITDADIVAYAGLSGDFEEIHISDAAAQAAGFERRIAHGPLSLVVTNGLIVQSGILRDRDLLMLGLKGNFRRPVEVGMTVQVQMRVESWRRSTSNPDRSVLELSFELLDCASRKVLTDGTWTEMFDVGDPGKGP